MSDQRTIISINAVTKRFGAAVTAVDRVSLQIREGEFFALLGPSGCGKTTLLRMIAGFEIPSEGEILIDGQDMSRVQPNRRPVNMVFQSYAVFPHLSVSENVGYGLKVTGVPRPKIQDQVEEALSLVKLDGLGARMPDQLSGGQRQRVALARALVKRPKVLLLDEPLSALDAKLREAMQLELVHLQKTVGVTFVIVTHDQSEALSMADRIAVMELGKVRQLAPPTELYEDPSCRFVADFIGKINLFEGQVAGLDSAAEGELSGGLRLLIDVQGLGRVAVPAAKPAQGALGFAVRPEKIRLDRGRPNQDRVAFQGRVTEVAYYGDSSFVYVTGASGQVLYVNLQNAARSLDSGIAVGDEVWCSWQASDSLILTE